MSDNAAILAHARSGVPLPSTEMSFTPPLDLTDIALLQGHARGTTLRASRGRPSSPLVNVKSTFPGDVTTGLPRRALIRDVRIVGNGTDDKVAEYGVQIEAAGVRLERVDVVNCYIGLVGKFMVDVACRDCLFSRNGTNVYLVGNGHYGSITTFRLSGCQVREATGIGILMQHALGVLIDDWTIVESNFGKGLVTEYSTLPERRIQNVVLGDVWFENNDRDEPIPEKRLHIVDAAQALIYRNAWS